MDKFNSKSFQVEWMNSKLEDKSGENVQNEAQGEKEKYKKSIEWNLKNGI